jgi:hypothetical protein
VSSLLEQSSESASTQHSTPIALPVVMSTFRVTKQPEHGTIETVATTNYVHYAKENIRSKCNQHKVKGTLVNYKAAEKYTGNDEFDLLILLPGGFAWELHFDMSVR